MGEEVVLKSGPLKTRLPGVKAEPEEYDPEEDESITVTLTDPDGNGTKIEATTFSFDRDIEPRFVGRRLAGHEIRHTTYEVELA